METEEAMQTDPAQTERSMAETEEHPEEHVHYPALSIWPITMALGIAFLGLGLVTQIWITYAGLFFMFIALVNWVQELRHEQH